MALRRFGGKEELLINEINLKSMSSICFNMFPLEKYTGRVVRVLIRAQKTTKKTRKNAKKAKKTVLPSPHAAGYRLERGSCSHRHRQACAHNFGPQDAEIALTARRDVGACHARGIARQI
jgi:hypothetical protein